MDSIDDRPKLKVVYSNADNLMNKRQELEVLIALQNPDIICVTEVVPKNTSLPVQTCELQIQGYELFTNLTSCSRGVLIYTKTGLGAVFSEVNDTCKADGSCWCEIRLHGNDRLLIGCVYRSPSSSSANNDLLVSDLKNICSKNFSHMLICGDFNLPDVKWSENCTCDSQLSTLFVEGFRDCFIHQHVLQPTHHRPGQTANTLDLVFTNEEGMVDDISYEQPLGKSHHSTLTFELKCYTKQSESSKPRFILGKANMEEIKKCLGSVDWESAVSGASCEEAWSAFTTKVRKCMEDFIPKTKPGSRKKRKPLWMDEKVFAKVRKKHAAYRRYMDTKEGREYQEYARARNQAKWECRKAVRDLERKIARESKTNPKAFFSYARSKLNTKTGVSDLTREDGSTANTDSEKADLLNSFFCSVFTKEDTETVPDFADRTFEHPLENVQVSAEEVKKKLQKLNPSKAMGPDGIPPSILKSCAEELSVPLACIMNKSIQEGKLPNEWKIAHVSPIFKKGKKTIPGNYRPVSLTCVCCKVLESILRDAFIQHFRENNLFSSCQHGFISGRSCSTNLIAVLDLWTRIIEDEGAVDTIYLDFAKAFDTVPHERLLKKMEGYGIRGPVLNWVRNFLVGRRQRVVLNGSESSWGDVLSGIPQGSVLGPFLFVCFVNDLPEAVHSACYLFADDTKLFARVPGDSHTLQEDLDRLQLWSDLWQLRFNASKCKVMHIGKQDTPAEYHMKSGSEEVILESCDVEKDLGVNVDSDLKFSYHVSTQTEKANKLLGLIRRGFTVLDRISLPALYKSIIRPHLEYGNVVWHPRLKGDEKQLENVQRRATKLIPELANMDYEERLRQLKLPSLYYRRARGDMIECYKYLHGIYDVQNTQSLLPEEASTSTRGHSHKLKKPFARRAVRANFFSVRVVNAWNSLPDSVVAAPTLNSFKSRLDKVWSSFMYSQDSDWFSSPPRMRISSKLESEQDDEEEMVREEEDRPADRHVALPQP